MLIENAALMEDASVYMGEMPMPGYTPQPEDMAAEIAALAEEEFGMDGDDSAGEPAEDFSAAEDTAEDISLSEEEAAELLEEASRLADQLPDVPELAPLTASEDGILEDEYDEFKLRLTPGRSAFTLMMDPAAVMAAATRLEALGLPGRIGTLEGRPGRNKDPELARFDEAVESGAYA